MAGNYRGYGDVMSVDAGKLTAAVASGDLINVNAQYGVAKNDGEANDPNEMQIEGVFELAKATGAGTGGNQGVKANADGSNLVTAAAGTFIGVFWADAGDSDTIALVKLAGNAHG